jgi:thiamine pyrophosphate-dependent acetolactate synthase large subunit-like protein
MPNCRAADVLADTLIAHGIDRAFCVLGESYLALLDALYDRRAVDLVVARHEGGAGFMAMADGKCAGRPQRSGAFANLRDRIPRFNRSRHSLPPPGS